MTINAKSNDVEQNMNANSMNKSPILKYHFAIDGYSFENIRNQDPELLKKVFI